MRAAPEQGVEWAGSMRAHAPTPTGEASAKIAVPSLQAMMVTTIVVTYATFEQEVRHER
jgi:hypothetical protein